MYMHIEEIQEKHIHNTDSCLKYNLFPIQEKNL